MGERQKDEWEYEKGAEAHKRPQPIKDFDLQKPKALKCFLLAECNASESQPTLLFLISKAAVQVSDELKKGLSQIRPSAS